MTACRPLSSGSCGYGAYATQSEGLSQVFDALLNNRPENSHQPRRQRERRMQRFKLRGQTQHFISAFGLIIIIMQHFRPRRHRFSAPAYCQEIEKRFHSWQDITVRELAA